MPDHKFTPEVLYQNTVTKRRGYGALSQRYAQQGNIAGAIHAAWASDVNAVQMVIWERVMIASPQPDDQFFAVATTIAQALANFAAAPTQFTTAKEVVEHARRGLATAFDPVAQALLTEQYISLDHLAEVPLPDESWASSLLAHWLEERSVEEMIEHRLHTASDCMAAAKSMNDAGRLDDAMKQAWQADWATFAAYLLASAKAVGDTALITVDMRWLLAVDAIGKVATLPMDFAEAVTAIRDSLTDSLGSIEGVRLTEMFEPI